MITSGFFNSVNGDRKYNAEQVGNMFEGLIGEGVFESVGGKFKVEANSGMTISVETGRAVVNTKWVKNDQKTLLNVTQAHVSLPRYTIVVLRHVIASRTVVLTTKDGTAAQVPVAPGVTRDDTAYEICLAKILVPAAAAAITQQDITDTRLDSTVCGYVTGLVRQVDTSTIYDQWEEAYAEAIATLEQTNEDFAQDAASMMANERAAFMSWFDTLASSLKVETYMQKYKLHTTLATIGSVTVPYTELSPSAYEYSSQDLVTVHINGLLAVQGTDYTVGTVGIVFTNLAATSTADIDIEIVKSRIGHNQEATGSVQSVVESGGYANSVNNGVTIQGEDTGTAYFAVGVCFDTYSSSGVYGNAYSGNAFDVVEESYGAYGSIEDYPKISVQSTFIAAYGNNYGEIGESVVKFTNTGFTPSSMNKCAFGLYHLGLFDGEHVGEPGTTLTLVKEFFNDVNVSGSRLTNGLRQVVVPPKTYNREKYILIAFASNGAGLSAEVQDEDDLYFEVIEDSLTQVVPKKFYGNDVSGNIVSDGGLIVGTIAQGSSRTVVVNIMFPQNADQVGYLLYKYEY